MTQALEAEIGASPDSNPVPVPTVRPAPDRDEEEDDPNALNSLSKFTLFETKS